MTGHECKLTDQDGYTRRGEEGELLWVENVTHKAAGKGTKLCSDGFIHYYDYPEIAVFMNPIHAVIQNPRCWEIAIGEGEIKRDGQLKSGTKGTVTTIREIPLPVITTEQKVEIAIRCAMTRQRPAKWTQWAEKWLSGEDRTSEAAYWAARAASWTASWAASWTASEAAYWTASDATSEASWTASWAAYEASDARLREEDLDIITIIRRVLCASTT